MSKTRYCILFIVAAGLLFACQKEIGSVAERNQCNHSVPTRVPVRIYKSHPDSIPEVQYNQSHCGYFPLNKNNYWVYRDTVFDYSTGQFISSRIDTVRAQKTYQSKDSIIWWQNKMQSAMHWVFYDHLYSTDTTTYILSELSFSTRFSIPWFFPVSGDSTVKINRWDDVSDLISVGKNIPGTVDVPAGSFSDCIYYTRRFTANPIPYIREKVHFKPQLGVIKYSAHSETGVKFYSIDLLSYHIE